MTSENPTEDDLSDVFLREGLHPTIKEHAKWCNILFLKCIDRPEVAPGPIIIDDLRVIFRGWALDRNVFEPFNVSLDNTLRFSPVVVDEIHDLLDHICETLMSLKPIEGLLDDPSTKRQPTSEHNDSKVTSSNDSDVDEEKQEQHDRCELVATIRETVRQLRVLCWDAQKSAKTNWALKIKRYIDDEEVNIAVAEIRMETECYIRSRFPMVPDLLRSALVEANAFRLRRLFYQRSHPRRIGWSLQKPQTIPPDIQLPKIKESSPAGLVPTVLPEPVTADKGSEQAGPLPVVPATNATTSQQTAITASSTNSTTEVPGAQPALGSNIVPCSPTTPTRECPYCGEIVELNTNKAWNNHVMGDLQPFTCTFPECLEACQDGAIPLTFESPESWIRHMRDSHKNTWVCYAPSHGRIIFKDAIQHQQHHIQAHGMHESHAEAINDAGRRLIAVSECPFCDEFQPPKEPIYMYSDAFSSKALKLHVAAHMNEVALLVLQKLPSNGVANTDGNVHSDQLSEDDDLAPSIRSESKDRTLVSEDLDLRRDAFEAANGPGSHREEDICAPGTISDPRDEADSEMTKLHRAVQAGDLGLVKELMSEGANLGGRGKGGRTALHYASMKESHGPDIMTLLLKTSGKAIVNLGDDSGQTALHYAAERGLRVNVDVLVDHGADVGTTDNYGFSPFLWAAVAGKQYIATHMLFRKEVDINSTSAGGKSALTWAAGLAKGATVEWLLRHDAIKSETQTTHRGPLEEAAASGVFTIVETLLGHGADPNYRDRHGWSAIHWAAEEGYLDVVSLLLKKGANVNTVSSCGTSPLHCAANGGHGSIVSWLLEHGANPLGSTSHGWTALHHAAFLGHSDVVKILLEDDRVRSRVSQQDNHGWTVLHLAVYSRDLATIDILLSSSVTTELCAIFDESGLTAEDWLDLGSTSHSYKTISDLASTKSRCCRATTGFRQAVATGNVPMIKLFIKTHHNINDANSGRRTALYYAVKKRMLSTVDLLLHCGADPNILPTGRKTWEEFVSDDAVLLRLRRSGYQRRDTDPEVERHIRRTLRSEAQFSMPNRSVSFPLDELFSPTSRRPTTHVPDQPSSSVPVSSETSVPDHSTPTRQTNNKKRKFDTIRPRARSL